MTSQSTVSYLIISDILKIDKKGSFYNFWFSLSSIMNDGQYQGEFALMKTLDAFTGSNNMKKDNNKKVKLEINGDIFDTFLASLKHIEISEKFLVLSNSIIDFFSLLITALRLNQPRTLLCSKKQNGASALAKLISYVVKYFKELCMRLANMVPQESIERL